MTDTSHLRSLGARKPSAAHQAIDDVMNQNYIYFIDINLTAFPRKSLMWVDAPSAWPLPVHMWATDLS